MPPYKTPDTPTQEDSWNAILSGATTGGILAARAWHPLEGMGIWMNNYSSMPPLGTEGEFVLVSGQKSGEARKIVE